jgi:hypothetical protein
MKRIIQEYFSVMWGGTKRLFTNIYEQFGWKGILLAIGVAAWLGYLTSHTH